MGMRPVLAAIMLLFLTIPGPASAARPCHFKGARTVVQNDQVRLFWVKGRGAEQRVYFGCERRRRPILLGADRIGSAPRTTNVTFRVAGTWVAWRQVVAARTAVVVRSLAGGGRSVRQDVSRYDLRNLHVAPDGAVAWILASGEFREVGGVAAGARSPSTLAVAAGIDSRSLTLRDGRVGWRLGTRERSARLTAPAAPPMGTSVGAQGLDDRYGDCGTLVPARPKAGPFTGAAELAADPAGGVVAAGTTTSRPGDPNAVQDTFVVARVTAAGRYDATFGSGGVVQVRVPKPAGARGAALTGLAVLPDGRVLAVGHVALAEPGRFRAVAMRFTAGGELDPSFGAGGIARNAVPASESSSAEDVALTPEGSALLAGRRDGRWFVARLGADGSLDQAFGKDGVVADDGRDESALAALAVTPDGTIFAAGGAGTPLLLRMAPDGTLLSVSSRAPRATVALEALELAPGGGVVALGAGADVRNGRQLVLARYTAQGKPDRSFGRGGFRLDHQISDPRDVAVAPDGSLLATGTFALRPGGFAGDGLARYTAGGARDLSFGLRGVLGGTSSFGLSHHEILPAGDGTALVAQDNAGAFAISRFALSGPAVAAVRSRPSVCAMATGTAIVPVAEAGTIEVSLRLRAPGRVRLGAVLEVGGRRILAGKVVVLRPYTEGAVARIPLTRAAAAALRDADRATLRVTAGAPGGAPRRHEAELTR